MASIGSDLVTATGADAPTGDSQQRSRRMRWTLPMITVLLELRLGVLHEHFKRSRGSAQRRDAWTELGDKFSVQLRCAPLSVLQLKNKFHALRREYVAVAQAIRSQRQEPQAERVDGDENSPRAIDLPSYWSTLQRYFQDVVPIPDEPIESSLTKARHGAQQDEAGTPGNSSDASLIMPQSAMETAAAKEDVGSSTSDPGAEENATRSLPERMSTSLTTGFSAGKSRRLLWTNDMVTTLLELRLCTLGPAFEAFARSAPRLRELWSRLRLKFSLQHNVDAEVLQLKNKFNSLRREYFTTAATIVQKQQRGRRGGADQVAHGGSGGRDALMSTTILPLYWSILVTYFGGLHGAQEGNGDPLVATEVAMDRAYPSRKRRREPTTASAESRTPSRLREASREEGDPPTDNRAVAAVPSEVNAPTSPNNVQEDDEKDGGTALATLVKLTRRLVEQQQSMQQQLDRQHAKIERMFVQSASVNATLLRFLGQEVSSTTAMAADTAHYVSQQQQHDQPHRRE